MRNDKLTFHTNLNLITSKVTNFTQKPFSKIPPYDVIYNFTFVSLIAPYLLNNLRLSTITSSASKPLKSTILLKQSYLIFTWFYYLSTSSMKTKNKSILFSFLPIKRKSYTLTKAPMAHKTNSKEQFVFKFYKFKACIKTWFTNDAKLSSVDGSLLALLLTKSIFPVFETNLLLLKHYTIYLTFYDKNYFNYAHFLKHIRK